MRKTWILLATAVLLLAIPSLAVAKGGQGGASFNVQGTITSLDYEDLTIMVDPSYPQSLKTPILVYTTADTRIKECVAGVSYRISFNDLVEGYYVKVSGVVVSGKYIASSVIQYPLK